MTMTHTKIQQAVAAILAVSAAGAASAVDITTVPAGHIVYVGGSTAITKGLIAYWANSTATSAFCNAASTAGVIDTYAFTGATNRNFIAVACAAGAGALSVAADTLIAFIKEDTGGSANG